MEQQRGEPRFGLHAFPARGPRLPALTASTALGLLVHDLSLPLSTQPTRTYGAGGGGGATGITNTVRAHAFRSAKGLSDASVPMKATRPNTFTLWCPGATLSNVHITVPLVWVLRVPEERHPSAGTSVSGRPSNPILM